MPTWLESLAHWVAASAAPAVQASVQPPGFCTFRFSQCRDPVLGRIYRDDLTAGGICEATNRVQIRR